MGLGMEDSKMNSHLFPPGSHRVTDEIGMHQRSDNIHHGDCNDCEAEIWGTVGFCKGH